MDKLHQNILRMLRKCLVNDVDVYNGIINPLKSEYILREEDIVKIQVALTKEERTEILLDILPSRGPYAFDSFRQALRNHYLWLSEDMDRLEASGKTSYDIMPSVSPTLPPMSPLTVIREEKMRQLKKALEKLEPDGYIALHGMKGFGKSCLTASTLKDMTLVRNFFYNEVYWVKFGYERPIDEEILIQLNRLYHLVKNLEIIPAPLKPEPLKDSLVHFLKQHFSKDRHRHALLILDDVCNKKIIQTFDFECKTLVITADIDYLKGKRPTVIEMNDGFTEAETLGLFAKVLDTDVEKLPLEAKRIHEECKGMPLLIAMFSAQFEEFKHDMNLRPNRWRYYLNCLRSKDAKNKVMREFFEQQETIFDMCIDQLPVEMKKRYEELAIFSEDVNIMPETLEILWDVVSTFEVEDIMLDLCHKSLAAKQWNVDLRSYIYGVHDLLLCHLRKKLSADKLVEMHRSLVEKYRKCCNGDFSKLPDDNYSLSYIGHHLEQAKLYDEFPNIYLDFNFIQSVINQTGLSNFLIDLENYKEYITKGHDAEYEARVNDLEKFLEEQAGVIAEHRRRKCLDIVQIAMNHPYKGFVKDTAIKMATQKSNTLYLLHDEKLGNVNSPFSQEVSTPMSTSCFSYCPTLILMGNEVGEVFLWDSNAKKLTVFNGHDKDSSITKIVVSSEGDCFLALTNIGVARLFLLHSDENWDENHRAVQSPRQKQSFWSGMFTNKIPQDDCYAMFSVPNEILLDVTFGRDTIAGCTNKGTIRVWDRRSNILSDHSHYPPNCHLKFIAFMEHCNLLLIIDENQGVLISYGKQGNEYSYISQYNLGLQQKKIIFFGDIPNRENSVFVVTETKAVYIKWFKSANDQLHSYSQQERACVESENTVYICAALTNDGQYIVLADSEGFINVWNTDTGYQPIATYKKRVSSLDTYWMMEEGCHIICGSENRLIHRWKLPTEQTQNSIRKPVFDAVMYPFGKVDTVAMETLSASVAIMQGNKIIAESEPVDGKIVHLILSDDGKKIVYVTEKGIVTLYDVKDKKGIPILRLSPTVQFVKILNIDNNDIVTCRGTDDNLKVWQNTKVTYLVEGAGYIISIHKLDKKCIVTVTRNGLVTVWTIDGTHWLRLNRVASTRGDTVITTYSCLNQYNKLLAVLNDDGQAILYKLQKDTTISPPNFKITEYLMNKFMQKLSCCEISDNAKYLAVGFENGVIAIIDIPMKTELHKFSFHTAPVTQLHWAPSTIDLPILLSINGDELVWWNIALAVSKSKEKERSFGRSISSPAICGRNFYSRMSGSRSAGVEVFEKQKVPREEESVTYGMYCANTYWLSKIGKNPEQPELLAVVELPPNLLAKVCVSMDFSKFLTVDVYGSVSTFKLFGYS